MWRTFWLSGLVGCAVAVPPQSQLTGVSGLAARTSSAVDVAAVLGVEPSVGLGVAASPARGFGIEARGQASDSSASVAPGLWGRTALDEDRRLWLGARLGPVVGTGEMGSSVPFDNPFAGGSAHLQAAWRFASEENPGVLSATAGFEWTEPLYGERHPRVRRVEGAKLVLAPGMWTPLDLRLEAPVGDLVAFTATVGADAYLLRGWTPRASIGLRYTLAAAPTGL